MSCVTLERRGHVGVITVNRPEALNAINMQMLGELDRLLDEIEADGELFVLVLTGAGRAFAAGADISEMADFSASEAERFGRMGNGLFLRLSRFPLPVIAAVNGYALGGGCELAMGCDIRFAGEKAKFGMPEVGLGIIPGFGGTQFLQRIVGASTAMELVLTNRTIGAEEALRIGLVDHVCAQEELLDKAVELAQQIAAKPQVAVRQAKQAIRVGRQVDLRSALEYEASAFGLCFSTEDQKDAMRAFLKKEPLTQFKNR